MAIACTPIAAQCPQKTEQNRPTFTFPTFLLPKPHTPQLPPPPPPRPPPGFVHLRFFILKPTIKRSYDAICWNRSDIPLSRNSKIWALTDAVNFLLHLCWMQFCKLLTSWIAHIFACMGLVFRFLLSFFIFWCLFLCLKEVPLAYDAIGKVRSTIPMPFFFVLLSLILLSFRSFFYLRMFFC